MGNYTEVEQSLIDEKINDIHKTFLEFGLTDKQFQVLYLFSNGYCDKLIARHTKTTPENIKKHILALKTKLDCTTRCELRMVYMTKLISECFYKSNQVSF